VVLRKLVVLLLAGTLAASAAAAPSVPAFTGDLASARAFMVDGARLYELKYRAKLPVRATNTVAALEALAQGRVELVGSARPADPRNPAETGLAFMPVAWDSLALIVHPGNPVKGLSLAQLRDIMAGRITDWSQLGGVAKPINLYAVAGPLDGVEFSLRRLLFGNGAAAVAAKRWYITTQKLEEAVSIDPVGLGVSLMSNVHGNKALRVLAIEGVQPTHVTLETGEYLLAIPLYLVARRDVPGQSPSVGLARRAVEFFSTEPAIRAAMRKKQLVPMGEARALGESQAARERFIVDTLKITLPGATALVAAPPPPTKPTPANAATASASTTAARPPAIAAETERERANALRLRDAPRREGCRPATVCD
jgi:phosphate transport system substrate-binding protein